MPRSANKKAPNPAPVGLYIHIPFCGVKCGYCDFYSLPGTARQKEDYTRAVMRALKGWSGKLNRTADTLYIGGGTPTQLDSAQLSRIITAARQDFSIADGEITAEANPQKNLSGYFKDMRTAGVNRISLGLQSANDRELTWLSRKHSPQDVTAAVAAAKTSGIDNISLDLMLGLQGQMLQSLRESIEFCLRREPTHISCYLLKIEPGTRFYQSRENFSLPDENRLCELYLYACETLEKHGFGQYEISNFARPGYESRHNLKYWRAREYLGVGAAAHSFIDNRRFYYRPELSGFIAGAEPVPDGEYGGFEEYFMLGLRLSEGVDLSECGEMLNEADKQAILKKAAPMQRTGLLEISGDTIRLTPQGFLVSNRIIGELIL